VTKILSRIKTIYRDVEAVHVQRSLGAASAHGAARPAAVPTPGLPHAAEDEADVIIPTGFKIFCMIPGEASGGACG